ncbi:MAG: hypothetical protein AAGF90_10485 [Pseudomonadota bacterium]
MSRWRVEQLTFGTPEGRFHAHSYYDVPALDGTGSRALVHRMKFEGRQPEPEDEVEVGAVDLDAPGSWTPLGRSRAWSWQQGPLAQWIAGGPEALWSDRDGDRFIGRVANVSTGAERTLPRPIYALEPEGRFGLSLDMARIDAFRPGYGFPGGAGARVDERAPPDIGVWRVDLGSGEARLILSLADAVAFLEATAPLLLRIRHRLGRMRFWFNHAKISPDGRRFTVKLRWRRPGGPWGDHMGVSLTASTDGGDLRLLTDGASHVMWLDPGRLYLWRRGELATFADTAPRGERIARLLPTLVKDNVHIRALPPATVEGEARYVYDTPYREDVDLLIAEGERSERLARFEGHRPAIGPFRCDLHPVPSADGRRILVTSLADGGRQVYAVSREDG